MPNDAWSCSVKQESNNGEIYDEPFQIDSPLFSIYISNMGRGPFCGEDINDTSCVVTDFYENQSVRLSSYIYDGNLGEIFGFIGDKAWISIHYQGMESRELTVEEKQELIELLDSIHLAK